MSVAAGVFFYASKTKRYLYLLRSSTRNACNWGMPGGKIEQNETLLEGIARECQEEIGFFPIDAKLIPIQKFTNHAFIYHTFFCQVDDERDVDQIGEPVERILRDEKLAF